MSDAARRIARMGLELEEPQQLAAATARDFAQRRLAPGAADRDRTGRFPIEPFGELAALGLHAMKVAERDGGAGVDNVGYLLAMEAIAEACASTAVVLASSNLTAKTMPRRSRSSGGSSPTWPVASARRASR